MTLPLLLDCDPGNDDALAILAAAGDPALRLLAVTTGAGHLAAERTARNGAIAVAAAGARVPVSRGAEGPLVRERMIAGILDMSSALDPERPDLAAAPLDPRRSAALIAETAAALPGLAVAATGPLTNLALALRSDRALAGRIGRIVFLGGSIGLGNKTAAAEWNVLCDPEAAAIVLGAGVPVTMIPIDAAAGVLIDEALLAEVEALGDRPPAPFAAELLRSLRSTFRPSLLGPPAMPLNDPLAVLLAARPELARSAPARVEVELAGRHTYGRTVVDFACRAGLPANVDVVLSFDVAATRRAFVAAIAALCHQEEAEAAGEVR